MNKLTLSFAVALLVSASNVFALDGYISTEYTCDQLQSIVQRDGEITILHSIGSMTFYSQESRCDEFPWHAEAETGYEPAKDTNHCFIGWECLVGNL
jgi:hypothetical protein